MALRSISRQTQSRAAAFCLSGQTPLLSIHAFSESVLANAEIIRFAALGEDCAYSCFHLNQLSCTGQMDAVQLSRSRNTIQHGENLVRASTEESDVTSISPRTSLHSLHLTHVNSFALPAHW